MDYISFLNNKLEHIRQEGRYRTFISLERTTNNPPYAIWHMDNGTKKEVVVFCTNDYLGMSHDNKVMQATHAAIDKYGVGSGGTRNISGTCIEHTMLERTVSKLHNKENSLIFTSGYIANQATLEVLGKELPDCVIFSDEKNHASIIHGIRNSGCERIIFPHNDMRKLEEKLQAQPIERAKIIAVVSLYSMDGDFADLPKLIQLAQKYNALIFLDEVHAVGVYGNTGAGLAEHLGVSEYIDIIQGNFAKGYGVIGGYIASNNTIIDFVRSFAPGFIFTTSLPPAIAAACVKSIEIQSDDISYRKKLWANVEYLKTQLNKYALPIMYNDSHIVPYLVQGAVACKSLSDRLLCEYGIYVQPINYPTVPIGQERLRITVTPYHTKEHIDQLCAALVALRGNV